jgi:hypothetical protein
MARKWSDSALMNSTPLKKGGFTSSRISPMWAPDAAAGQTPTGAAAPSTSGR